MIDLVLFCPPSANIDSVDSTVTCVFMQHDVPDPGRSRAVAWTVCVRDLAAFNWSAYVQHTP